MSYRVMILTEERTLEDFRYSILNKAELRLKELTKTQENGWVGAYIREESSTGHRVIRRRNFLAEDTYTDSLLKKEPKMTIHTFIITDLQDKYLGCQAYTSGSEATSFMLGFERTQTQDSKSIGKVWYTHDNKRGILQHSPFFRKSTAQWVMDLLAPTPKEIVEETPEWTNWSTKAPPHLSRVLARRYGATSTEIDTKYLPSSFDPHGMEWKLT